MTQEGPKAVVSVVAEDNTKEGLDRVKRGIQETAQTVVKAGQEASKGISKMGEGADQTARKLESFEKSWVNSVQRALVAAEAGEKGTAKYFEAWGKYRGIGGDVMEPILAQLRAVEAAQAAAAGAATKGLGTMGVSAAQTAAALRQVPAQFTDIVVSLQAGQAPLTVLLQQGGQLKDMFGGTAAAAKALGGYVMGLVSPLTLVAAAGAATAVAFHQGAQENEAFVRSIALTGNASGVTTSQLREYARQIDSVVGTQAQAASGLADFVAAGVRGGDELRRYTQTAIEWEKLTGQAVSKTADQFASLQKDPLAAVIKLNEGTNFLTVSVYEQIKALEDQGRKADASKVAMDALDGAMRERGKTIKDSLGYIERGWNAIKGAASDAWDAMLNVGRAATINDQLAVVQKELSSLLAQSESGFGETGNGAATGRSNAAYVRKIKERIDALKAEEWALYEKADAEKVAAMQREESTRRMQALLDFDKDYAKALEKETTLQEKLAKVRREGEAAGKSESEIKQVLTYVTEQHNKANQAGAKAAKEHAKELAEQAKVYAELAGLSSTYYKDLEMVQKRLAAGKITQEQYVKFVEDLIKKQPFAIALVKEEEKARRDLQKAIEDDIKQADRIADKRQAAIKSVEDALLKARQEEQAHALAAAANITLAEAVERLTIARLEGQLQMARMGTESQATIDALERELRARKELLGVLQQKGVREANKKAADEAAKDWDRTAQTISRTLSDYIMAGGKNAAQYLKRLFATLVLEPVVQTVVGSALGVDVKSAAGGAGNVLGSLSNISKLSSLFGGGATAGASLTSLGFANAVGLAGGDAIGALAAANGMWAGVATGAQAAAQAAVAANLALEAGTAVAMEAGTMAAASGAASGASGISAALGSIPGWGWALAGGALLLSQLDFGSRGANHSGAAASSLGIGNTAAAQKLMGDSRGDWYTDLTTRYNADLDKQLSGTVGALAGVYEKLSGYAGDAARSIELVGGFAVNGKYGDEGAVGYGQLWDRVSGQYLGGFSNRDLGTDKDKAWTSFVGQMGGLIVAELKASDIPGWMRKELEAIGDNVTVDGLEKALTAIAAADAAFKGWGDTLTGFANLSAEVQTSLLATSGTLEGLATNVNTFYSGFYTEQERMATLQRQVLAQLGSLGVTVDTSTAEAAKASFKATVEGALNAGNGELAAKLLALSGSFATAADYAAQSAEQIVQAAQESATAAAELAANLRSSLIDLGARLPGAGEEVKQLRVEGLASQVQGLFAGIGIEKDAGVLAGQIMSATSSDIEQYFRDMWGMLDTDEARQKLVTVTGALLDLAGSAETAANSVKQERAGLEQRWLQATGNTAELRRRELEALDPSNRALLQMIYGLEDAKTSMTDLTNAATTAAQKAAAAWQNWGTAAGLGATYLGDTSGLEARRAILGSQIAGSTDPADRLAKLQELISVEQAIGQAQQASRKTELEAIQARQSALQKEVASAQQLLSAAQGLGSYVQSLRLGEASGLSEADRLGALGSEYTSLVGKARGGDADALQRLQSVAGDYLGLSRSMSASGSDYALLAGRVSSELEAVAKAQELVAQSGITAREAEMAQLTQQTEFLSAGVELSDEVKRLIQKSALEQQDAWGRESMRAETLQELQQRAVDSLALMPAGIASAIKPTIESSATYIANSVGGSVSSAINALAGMLDLDGSHAAGLAFVPRDGYRAELHYGERVLTASENRMYSAPMPVVMQQAAFSSGSNNARMEALMERLIEDNRRQAGEIVRLNLRVARMLEYWEGGGMPPPRKEGATA